MFPPPKGKIMIGTGKPDFVNILKKVRAIVRKMVDGYNLMVLKKVMFDCLQNAPKVKW